jgi:DNA helicase-2/ATP-dependent DNA helicase PcrA
LSGIQRESDRNTELAERPTQPSVADWKSSGSTPLQKHTEIRYERAVEVRYGECIRAAATRPIQPDGPRNGAFTGTRIRQPKPVPRCQLEGRVALTGPDEALGGIRDFYIGHAYACVDGIEVFNWRSPLGRSFFDPDFGDRRDLNVAGLRTFAHRGGQIVDFVDDYFVDSSDGPVFRPQPVTAERSKVESQPPVGPHSDGLERADSPRNGNRQQGSRPGASKKPPSSIETDAVMRPFVRAEPLLREQLNSPKAAELTAVLSTLQPDQYRLVTESPYKSIVIDGGPGTGKTIIASHRAAYFITDDASCSGFRGDVLVIGPSSQYSKHISSVIDELTGGTPRIVVLPLQEAIRRIEHEMGRITAGDLRVAEPSERRMHELVRLAKNKFTSGLDTRVTTAQLYQYMRTNVHFRSLPQVVRWVPYLKSLPPYAEAKTNIHALKLLKALGDDKFRRCGDLDRNWSLSSIQHVVVDEAQDVTADEWAMLQSVNRGSWTILGDLNQRRADRTPNSWEAILVAAGLPSSTRRVHLERGYRSTVPILRYANRLLPPDAPTPMALQIDGPEPKVVTDVVERLPKAVLREARELCAKYSGTIAVISPEPGRILPEFRGDLGVERVQLLTPDQARGLEFDAVIVVEPADFRRNDRRHGPLYTSLTRPNKELVVVHTKPLPPQLRTTPRPSTRPAAPARLVAAQPKAPETSKKPKRKRAGRHRKASRKRRNSDN